LTLTIIIKVNLNLYYIIHSFLISVKEKQEVNDGIFQIGELNRDNAYFHIQDWSFLLISITYGNNW